MDDSITVDDTPGSRRFHLRARARAFLWHCCFSVVLIGAFLWITIRFWYPDGFFRMENVYEALRILVPVDAILGPILTFLLYVPAKRGVKTDIALVVLAQVLALVYGGHVIYQQRPAALVFAADRFEVIPASKLAWEKLPEAHFQRAKRDLPFMAYALPAQDAEENNRFVLEFVAYQKMAERYRPVASHLEEIRSRALDPARITPKSAESKAAWDQFRAQHPDLDRLLFLPLECTTMDWYFIVLDRETGQRVAYLMLDAWGEYDRSQSRQDETGRTE